MNRPGHTQFSAEQREQPSPTARRRHALLLAAPCLLLIVLHTALALTRNRPLIFADEAGYIGNARYLAGGLPIKLVHAVTYSPGYSLLISPLFWLGLTPSKTYQAILIVNGLLLSASYILLVQWSRKVLLVRTDLAYAIAFATSLYPTFIVQPLFAMSESAIIFMWCALPLCVHLLVRSKSVASGVLVSLLVAFLFAIHPRYIGTVFVSAAGLLALGATRVLPARTIAASLAALGVGLLVARQLSRLVNAASQGTAIRGDGKLMSLTRLEGIWAFLVEATGQFWYLLAASAGFAIVGLIVMVTRIIRPVSEGPRRASPEWNTLVFTATSGALAFGVASLFLSRATRVDHFIYGRYNEGVMAPFLATGLWSLTQVVRPWWRRAWRSLALMATTVVLAALLLWARGEAWQGRPNLANVLALLPQLEFFEGNDLLAISLVAGAGYLAAHLAAAWRPWLGLALTGAAFAFVGYSSHEFFLGMQKGRAKGQAFFEPMAKLESLPRVSYDASFFNPVMAFFGQYFLHETEFEFFQSGKGEAPTAPYVFGHQDWAMAKSLERGLITKNKRGYSIWNMEACCLSNTAGGQALGAHPVQGIAESGFYSTEAWPIGDVRWTNGDARLSIPVSGGLAGSSNLYVDLASVGPSSNRVTITANGRDLFKGRLSRGRSRLLLPLEAVSVDGALELAIQSRTFVPGQAGTSTDERQLGVAIHSIRVLPECCLTLGDPFSAGAR